MVAVDVCKIALDELVGIAKDLRQRQMSLGIALAFICFGVRGFGNFWETKLLHVIRFLQFSIISTEGYPDLIMQVLLFRR